MCFANAKEEVERHGDQYCRGAENDEHDVKIQMLFGKMNEGLLHKGLVFVCGYINKVECESRAGFSPAPHEFAFPPKRGVLSVMA